MTATVDLLLYPAWVIPVDAPGVLADHAVAVHGGRVFDVLPAREARQRYLGRTTLELPGRVLIPGLINLHCHAAMSLLRGYGDDMPLMEWLKNRIWPAEKHHVGRDFVFDGSLLACAEMLRGGITAFNDMYFFPDATAESVLKSGMRAVLGMIVIGLPTAYAADPDDYLDKGLAIRDRFKGERRLGFSFAPHAPYTVDDAAFARIATLSGQLELPIHIHVHETVQELAESERQFGVRPLERLARLGLLSAQFIGVHAVHLTPAEMEALARHGCHVAHCPASNLKLAAGIAPLAALRAAGVNVALGTDGPASNNRLDLLEEMRLAALLAKGASGDPTVANAAQILSAATINAARALGQEESLGSITPGKRADLVAVRLDGLEHQPVFDPLSQLVYVAGRQDVTHVWVDGEARVSEGRLLGLDESDLRARVNYWRQKLLPNA